MICIRCEDAYYCDAKCQKSHWRQHKEICNLDRRIHRVGILLQEILYIWAEKTHLVHVVKVESREKELIVTYNANPNGYFDSFPNHLINDENDKGKILADLYFDAPLAYFKGHIDCMLEGIYIRWQALVNSL